MALAVGKPENLEKEHTISQSVDTTATSPSPTARGAASIPTGPSNLPADVVSSTGGSAQLQVQVTSIENAASATALPASVGPVPGVSPSQVPVMVADV